jgi:aldehyde:ferredoxin oxidoreductase
MGIGVTYATSPMGADHTAGYAVATNIMGVGGSVDPLKPDGQVELSRNLQIATAAIDSAGLCVFVAFPALDIPAGLNAIPAMLNGLRNFNLNGVTVRKKVSPDDFNAAAGYRGRRSPSHFFKTGHASQHRVPGDDKALMRYREDESTKGGSLRRNRRATAIAVERNL